MVEGGSLENCCAERYRGFESYFLRQLALCFVLQTQLRYIRSLMSNSTPSRSHWSSLRKRMHTLAIPPSGLR